MDSTALLLSVKLATATVAILLTAGVLTFAHTLGEFGVVLMVGGSIPGETKTIAISIYDRVQGFDMTGAGLMSLLLLGFSVVAIGVTFVASARHRRRHARFG